VIWRLCEKLELSGNAGFVSNVSCAGIEIQITAQMLASECLEGLDMKLRVTLYVEANTREEAALIVDDEFNWLWNHKLDSKISSMEHGVVLGGKARSKYGERGRLPLRVGRGK